ncbi:adenylate/guanylate cyclase domain-containing protein [Kitasatospora indigofera]|uniref:adenylate/guanylate cyclase domain-containing protein n=1 Tax=Kitasatospora indigofera TaxID=67307 RepID=UPI00364477B7
MECPSCTGQNAPGARFCMACGRPLEAAAQPVRARRTVTVVFADLAGSTALAERLDPEALREVMLRYYTLMRDCLEHHGGTVEKFIGDAVMAVFGVPRVREDDVLRGVRAAWDMQQAMDELNAGLDPALRVRLRLRIGVNTGEVLWSREFGDGHAMVSGDTVNVAARLEQHAPDGGILLGAVSHRVAAPGITAEPVEPLTVKGKSRPLAVWRLTGVQPDPEATAGPGSARLIGRREELHQLELARERSVTQRGCHLFTLLGDPGVGKSRLVAEFLAGLREGGGAVAVSRCHPYGGAGTLQTLAELLRQAMGAPPGGPAGGAGPAGPAAERAALRALLDGQEGGPAAVALLGSVLDGTGAATEDTFWATGLLLQALGELRPVTLVFDDLQWAQPTLLDLIDHLADWTAGAPLLLLCLARLDLLDVRPGWGGAKLSATSLVLGPLSPADCEELVESCAEVTAHSEAGTVRRVAAAAEGNPLFAEQLVAVLADGGTADELPPTVQALLEARLDRLPRAEREVLEHASVIGREFTVPGLRDVGLQDTALRGGAPGDDVPAGAAEQRDRLTPVLQALLRRRLVEPAGRRPGAAGYRFVHLLVREVCYAGLPKRRRAALHEAYAGRLAAGEPVRHELVGRHLAEAHRHHRDLGSDRQGLARLGAGAARHLLAAGERALARGECSWAAELLTQAAELAQPGTPDRSAARLRLAEALIATGAAGQARDLLLGLLADAPAGPSAGAVPASSASSAPSAPSAPSAGTGPAGTGPDPCPAAHARLHLAYLAVPETGLEPLVETARELLPVFTAAADELGQARARLYVAHGRQARGRYVEAAGHFEAALASGGRAGAVLEQATALGGLAVTLWLGPEPVPAAVARCRELLAGHAAGRRAVRAALCCPLAVLLAMGGDFTEARALVAEAERIAEDLGVAVPQAAIQTFGGLVETLAGAPGAAEERLRRACALALASGDPDTHATAADTLAALLLDQGRHTEAQGLADAVRAGAGDSPLQRAEHQAVRARLAAAGGQHDRAAGLAAEAVRLAESTDSPVGRAQALLNRAVVLLAVGDQEHARTVADRAERAFTGKGHLVGALRAARLRDGGPR